MNITLKNAIQVGLKEIRTCMDLKDISGNIVETVPCHAQCSATIIINNGWSEKTYEVVFEDMVKEDK